MTSGPVTQATTLAKHLNLLKEKIAVHNKLIERFMLHIATATYTDAAAALDAVVSAPLKPLIGNSKAPQYPWLPDPSSYPFSSGTKNKSLS
jgi:hypothetical protein